MYQIVFVRTKICTYFVDNCTSEKECDIFSTTVETAFYDHPLVQQKPVLKRQVVCETRVAKTSPCKVNTFFSSKSKRFKTFSEQSQPFAAVYTDILHLCCACKIWRSLVTSGAGSRSPQRLFCTESSMHGISIIKSRRSLTTEIVKSSFNCSECFV